MSWCPGPDCQNAVKANYHDALPVTCYCGYTFCFGCGEPVHEPVRCPWLKKWIKKCNDDSETSNWISANTKECPKCHVTIEKNGGCNHMVCRNNNCKVNIDVALELAHTNLPFEFRYSCNRYDEKDAQAARDAQAKSRQALERYLFYCNRYMNHAQSAKFETKLYAQVKQKMEEMQQHNMSWIEVQFLRKAVDVLCLCRNTLKYTYVFAFYLKKNNQSVIFEVSCHLAFIFFNREHMFKKITLQCSLSLQERLFVGFICWLVVCTFYRRCIPPPRNDNRDLQVQFLRKAVDVLCLCRNTLKYTYVFAFYLKKNNQSVIFE
ncbi:PREDICTED: E3 ubiquitin-protein ligase arih1-like, partial [Acropora digitifera]|uniref:E3 ubiquitin-protein ligase arih1-like n=1 Tax=Acropora digitifera TaxID=70779 RepID=UPI00077A8C6F